MLLEPSCGKREKEEKHWKRFFEKFSEEKNILTVENPLSEIPSEVKEFVEKNDTTGGGSFSESFDSAGNQNSNEEENKNESVEEISPPPPKITKQLPYNEISSPLHKPISSR